MTFIKALGLGIDEPPPKNMNQIGFRTHNHINQGDAVKNSLTPPRKTSTNSKNWKSS